MRLAQATDIREKLAIMASIPLFSTLGAKLDELSGFCDIQVFPPNGLIVCEGDVADYIYFIHSGSCRIIKSVLFAKQQLDRKKFKLVPVSAAESASEPPPSSGSNSVHAPGRQPSALVTKFLVVRRLHPGDVFYDARPARQARDLILQCGLPSSVATASLVANLRTEVLRISKLDFNKLATRATWHAFATASAASAPVTSLAAAAAAASESATAPKAGSNAATAAAGREAAVNRLLADAYMSKRSWDVYKRRTVAHVVADIRRQRAAGVHAGRAA
ncbi:hypothetical protein HK405_005471 [Cladochytrium tenue]|nr:hypothetical protein HK405_005471 [Cladochytrium tenue]